MGYRSEVHIAMTKTRFRDMIPQAPNEDIRDYILSSIREYNGNSYMVELCFEYVKWYPDYEEVAFIDKFLSETEDGYAFCRIGEDSEDNELHSDEGTYGDFNFSSVFWISRIIRTELQ